MRDFSCLLFRWIVALSLHPELLLVHGFTKNSLAHPHAIFPPTTTTTTTVLLMGSGSRTGGAGTSFFRPDVIDEDDDDEDEIRDNDGRLIFSDKKTQLRLDGLEPYVLVSAITATASFDVVTGGNLFDNSPIFKGEGSLWDDVLRALLLVTNTSSSCLGLYALGIFSFCIMYSKAALAREDDDSHVVYDTFFKFTASYRYKGYQAFLWSLILFVIDLFLFAIAYLPEQARPVALLVSAPLIYTCWNDWQAIIKEASIIYAPIDAIREKVDKLNSSED